MPMPNRGRLGLQLGTLVGREVRQDEAAHAGLAQAPQHGRSIPAAEHLVDVAHGHQRRVRPGRVDAPHERDRIVERRTVRQGDGAGPLERGAIGQRIRIGQPDLEQVGPAVDVRERDVERRVGIGVAGHRVRGSGRPGPRQRRPANAAGDAAPRLRDRGSRRTPTDHARHQAVLDGGDVLVAATGEAQQDDVVISQRGRCRRRAAGRAAHGWHGPAPAPAGCPRSGSAGARPRAPRRRWR